jgi:hypothetical protein
MELKTIEFNNDLLWRDALPRVRTTCHAARDAASKIAKLILYPFFAAQRMGTPKKGRPATRPPMADSLTQDMFTATARYGRKIFRPYTGGHGGTAPTDMRAAGTRAHALCSASLQRVLNPKNKTWRDALPRVRTACHAGPRSGIQPLLLLRTDKAALRWGLKTKTEKNM